MRFLGKLFCRLRSANIAGLRSKVWNLYMGTFCIVLPEGPSTLIKPENPQVRGSFLESARNKDRGVLGSILGSP